MKLIKRTYYYTALWLIPVMIIGSIFSFYMIEYISYEETDEFLTYEMERLIRYHKEHNELPEYHRVANIIPDVYYEKPFFKDTLILEPADNEMVPYRELHFSINHKGRDFGIVLQHLLLGRDDIAQGTLLIILGLILLTALFVLLIINQVTGRIWKPFYITLDKTVGFNIEGPLPDYPVTSIDEFKSLNKTLRDLLKKIKDDYRNNRQFNENASHELQTHLAVIMAGTEKLINEAKESEQGMEELRKIYSASRKLSKVQRSLLLLSRISNREFKQDTRIKLKEIVEQSVGTFREAIEIREIKLDMDITPVTILMDPGLAEILVNNLVKNAVKHNVQQGFISIDLQAGSLIIENSGPPYEGNPEDLLERFARGREGNLGIGLAIVKQICELYNYSVSYTISEENRHIIRVNF